MRHRVCAGITCGVITLAVSLYATGRGEQGPKNYSAELISYQEVPANSSAAVGNVSIVIDDAARTIAYTEAFSGLEGSVIMSHIHLAQPGVNGGIMVWLCGTSTNPGPTGTPVCPASGEVSGTLSAADVVGPGGQGVSAGEFDEVVAAIRAGVAYANVHSTRWPGGEIRGQLRPGGGHQ